jgi:hypothetical protein
VTRRRSLTGPTIFHASEAGPDKALVFPVGEKSPIQALDRTQPGLLMKKGLAGTMTHHRSLRSTSTGRLIGQCIRRHHHQE